MSANITCSCPVCGELTLDIGVFQLAVHPLDSGRSFYQFTCPKCKGLVTKQAHERVITGLVARGVVRTNIPAEADEPHSGKPLNLDDLIDLGIQLARL